MSTLDDLRAAVAALQADITAGESAVAELRVALAGAVGLERAQILRALARAERRLNADRVALTAAQTALATFLSDPLAQLPGGYPIALLPVRMETRFVTNAGAPELLVRVYPDQVAVDDHRRGVTEAERAAAARFWERLWRAGRSDADAERAAFTLLASEVGVSRALWLTHATQPDERNRPTDPVPEGTELVSPPVLADVPLAADADLEPAVSRVMPDRWTVLGFRGGARVVRADGAPIRDPLPIGPSADGTPPATNGARDGVPTPPLEEDLSWLADFDAAVAAGMGIRVPLSDTRGFDRLVVLGVRTRDDPKAGAQRLADLLAAHRYTDGLGFLTAGAPTNNTGVNRSAWTRRPDAGEAFDSDRRRDVTATASAGAAAAALGLDLEAVSGVERADDGDTRDARAMQLALWPATIGYFLETLVQPAVDDATVEAARELFIDSVRGLGSLPMLRIGRQPYGLLPVMALRRWHPGPDDAPQHATLVELLRKLAPEWLATTRPGGPRAVPYVGRPGADPDQELLDILGRDAQAGSYRLRPARGGLTSRALTPLIGTLDAAGGTVADAAHRLLGGGTIRPRLARLEWETKTRRIRRASVIGGALSETEPLAADANSGLNYLQYLSRRGEADGPFAGPGTRTLLFKLALHACALADADAAVRLRRPASVIAVKAPLEPDLVDPGDETLPRLMARPARDVVSAQLPAGQTVAQLVATATPADLNAIGLGDIGPAFFRARELRRALAGLARRPTAHLDRLARATLDVCSHRLDAWITAYATRRLAEVREQHPDGVLVGGYGWVEDLRPKPPPQPVSALPEGEPGPLTVDPTTAGYVAAPSATQAVTAALLLSGHLNNRGTSGPATQAFAVDLSSDRVRLAKWLLDGIRQGQPLGALLGYRFERSLHDRSGAGLELDRFIRPLRALAPLVAGRTEEVDATVEAVESVAASNVVDGMTLLARFRANASSPNAALAGASAAERSAVLEELGALADAADALADLMCAETAYQLASGNIARAAASLDGLGAGLTAPPEPEVVRTPRGGHAYAHRLLSLAPPVGAAPPGWETAAARPRQLAEPRLDAWVAGLLGPADAIRAALRFVGADGAIVGGDEVTVAEIGACALDIVYDAPGDFELMIADHVEAGGGVPAGAHVELVHEDDPDWPGAAWPPGTLALDDALEQGRWIADSVGTARPLTAVDLAPPGATTDPGVDELELAGRTAEVADRYRAASGELRAALDATASAQQDARVRAALRTLAGFGVAGARAAARAGGADAGAILADTARVIELVDEPAANPDRLVAALKAMLGPAFTVLPVLGEPPAGWSEALAAGAAPAFLGDDSAGPLAWLQRVANTRAPVERYLLATTGAGGFTVAQTPSTPRWVGLPLTTGQPGPAGSATSILLHRARGTSASGPGLAGLVIDEWGDVIPARDTTAAVTFQFDEPGSRAPQALLLAVPPRLDDPWTFDVLADTIAETADLARIRMVGPEDVPWLGRYLPALYVADNPGGDTFTTDLHELATTAEVDPS